MMGSGYYPLGADNSSAPWNHVPAGQGHKHGECEFMVEVIDAPNKKMCVCTVDKESDEYYYVEASWDCDDCETFCPKYDPKYAETW